MTDEALAAGFRTFVPLPDDVGTRKICHILLRSEGFEPDKAIFGFEGHRFHWKGHAWQLSPDHPRCTELDICCQFSALLRLLSTDSAYQSAELELKMPNIQDNSVLNICCQETFFSSLRVFEPGPPVILEHAGEGKFLLGTYKKDCWCVLEDLHVNWNLLSQQHPWQFVAHSGCERFCRDDYHWVTNDTAEILSCISHNNTPFFKHVVEHSRIVHV